MILALILSIIYFTGSTVAQSQPSRQDINRICLEGLASARTYCRPGGDEPPAVKPKCDAFRHFCPGLPIAPPAPPAKCQQIAYCNQNADKYSMICSNPNYAGSDHDRREFCSSYPTLCTSPPKDLGNQCKPPNDTAPAQPSRVLPNPFNGPPQSPGLLRLTDLNGGGPLATVGQSPLDNVPENMVSSTLLSPLVPAIGQTAGNAANAAGKAKAAATSGNYGQIGGLFNNLFAGAAQPTPGPESYGAGLGIQTVPGFDPPQQGPFGTKPIWVGNKLSVGPFAGGGQNVNLNPFGKAGWGSQFSAMGISGYRNAGGFDYGSVPGLTDINNPLVGGRKRRRRNALIQIVMGTAQ